MPKVADASCRSPESPKQIPGARRGMAMARRTTTAAPRASTSLRPRGAQWPGPSSPSGSRGASDFFWGSSIITPRLPARVSEVQEGWSVVWLCVTVERCFRGPAARKACRVRCADRSVILLLQGDPHSGPYSVVAKVSWKAVKSLRSTSPSSSASKVPRHFPVGVTNPGAWSGPLRHESKP